MIRSTSARRALSILGTSLLAAVGSASPAIGQSSLRWIWTDIYGGASGEQLAEAILGVGDFDHDERDDFLVGIPGRNGTGAIAMISGATGREMWSHLGTAPSGRFGATIADVRDLDGDQVRDWLVGAPAAGAGGEVWIFSGATRAPLGSIATPYSGIGFGTAIAGLEDIDNDGACDFAVSSPWIGLRGQPNIGMVEVFSGRSRSLLRTHYGTQAQDTYGMSLSTGSDLNGDGICDLVIGAPSEVLPRVLPGYVHVLSGYDGSQLRLYAGAAVGDLFGCAVAGIGDVDQDGTDDVLIGARAAGALPSLNYGMAFVYSGATSLLLHQSSGGTNQRYGMRVSALGDVNGDQQPDYAIGAGVIGSYSLSFVRIFSSYGTLLQSFGGSTNAFGLAAVNVGDIDDDGFVDIAFGAPNADRSSTVQECGRVSVCSLLGTAGVYYYLRPCGSSLAPLIQGFGGAPNVMTGNPNFGLTLRHAAPLMPTVMFIGRPTSQWNGINMPLDLTPFGLTDCWLGVAIEVQLSLMTDAQGTVSLALPIPRWAALRNYGVNFQAVTLNPNSPLGLDFSRTTQVSFQ
jgi:hypothetical protein